MVVLLDAGAGPDWVFYPRDDPKTAYNRSEGLALASLDWFTSGGLSSDPSQPIRVDSVKLKSLTENDLKVAFQVSDSNPLVGIERVGLLIRLGNVIEEFKYFDLDGPKRPGNLLDFLENMCYLKLIQMFLKKYQIPQPLTRYRLYYQDLHNI